MKKKSIVRRFAWTIGSLTSLLILILIGYTAFTNLNIMGNSVKQYVMEVNKLQSSQVALEFDKTEQQVKMLAEVFQLPSENREFVIQALQNSFSQNDNLYSLSTIWESNGFDGRDIKWRKKAGSNSDGRFIPSITQKGLSLYEGVDVRDNQDFLRKVMESDIVMVSDPHMRNGILCTSIAAPIVRNGKNVGVVCADLKLEEIQRIMEGADVFRGIGEISVVANNGIVVANSKRSSVVGKSVKDLVPDFELHMSYLKSGKEIMWDDGQFGYIISPLKIGNPNEPWQIFITGPVLAIMQDALHQLKVQVSIGLLVVLAVILIVIIVVKRAFKPLIELTGASSHIAKGDLSKRIAIKSTDEIGQLASTFNEMAERLSEVIGVISENTLTINSASQELTSISQQLSQGASEQASSTEEISSSMEEMTSNIQQNTDNANHTEKMANKVEEGMNKVSTAASQSMASVKEISESIAVITEIAFQTNILALNAAVEAARAGESGRGFAVVAAEVRKLAERSRTVANQVAALAKKSLEDTKNAGDMLNAIIPDIKDTARLIQEIAASSYEQNTGAEQINSSIQQLNQVTQQNAAVAETVSSNAEELASKVAQLEEAISYFKLNE